MRVYSRILSAFGTCVHTYTRTHKRISLSQLVGSIKQERKWEIYSEKKSESKHRDRESKKKRERKEENEEIREKKEIKGKHRNRETERQREKKRETAR